MYKYIRNSVIVLIAAFCISYPVYILMGDSGFFHRQITQQTYQNMILELLIWFIIALLGVKWGNVTWIIGIGIVFTYLHMMFLPMAIAVIYVLFTILVGKFANRYIMRSREKNILFSCFTGMMILTICYALLSLAKIGSIRNILLFDTIMFGLLALWFWKTENIRIKDIFSKLYLSTNKYVKLCLIMIFIMLGVGRANESLDYDSLWYGLRSAYVLDNLTGIYDDLKLMGCVYTYPKGYEAYSLPLSGFDSYGFVYAGNIVLAVLIIYTAYCICRLFLNCEQALWGAVFISAVPGIMNMAITAKPDIITLFIQVLSIYFALLFLKEEKGIYLGIVVAAYIYAQTLKTTAVIFSTTILLLLIFICIVYRKRPRFEISGGILNVIAGINLALIWLRTYWLTGIPATSVWGRIFRFLGMKEKYPYASGQINQFRSGDLFSKEVIDTTITRLKEFFFAPNSADTDHIIIAWGTTLCTFLFILVIIGGLFNIRKLLCQVKENAIGCFMGLLLLGEFFGCILSLWLLSKPDGNYFMLFYSVTVLVGVVYVQKELVENKVFGNNVVKGIFITFIPFNVLFTGAVTWGWTAQFQKINWVNRGYYNHRTEYQTQMYNNGCREIYDIISEKSSNKVYAFGEHPFVERFPCIVESETDISFWGNSELVSTAENFFEFLKYEQYDYILICPGYISEEDKYFSYFSTLIESGEISNIVVENGYILFQVGKSPDEEAAMKMRLQFEDEIASGDSIKGVG